MFKLLKVLGFVIGFLKVTLNNLLLFLARHKKKQILIDRLLALGQLSMYARVGEHFGVHICVRKNVFPYRQGPTHGIADRPL